MYKVCVLGAGQIGKLIAVLLARSGDYQVSLTDILPADCYIENLLSIYPAIKYQQCNASEEDSLMGLLSSLQVDAVVSSLPFHCNVKVAKVARELGLHYFDLTEDRETTAAIKEISEGSDRAFVPQCGVAPGFVNWVAHDLMLGFDKVDEAKLAVGALPQHTSNAYHYALNWSTEGLVNEYMNSCDTIEAGKITHKASMTELESVSFDGVKHEMFHTSGGLGSLADYYAGEVNNMYYKTIRYPGHCEKMNQLIKEYDNDRQKLCDHLEKTIPTTKQDVVIVYVSVCGKKQGRLEETNFVRKYFPVCWDGMVWTAIQLTTANGLCCALHCVLSSGNKYQGFLGHHDFRFDHLIDCCFGDYYLCKEAV